MTLRKEPIRRVIMKNINEVINEEHHELENEILILDEGNLEAVSGGSDLQGRRCEWSLFPTVSIVINPTQF
jgi:hypothetical protein